MGGLVHTSASPLLSHQLDECRFFFGTFFPPQQIKRGPSWTPGAGSIIPSTHFQCPGPNQKAEGAITQPRKLFSSFYFTIPCSFSLPYFTFFSI